MAQLLSRSSSSSSSDDVHKYDVFLSFRGEDTRNSFTDHLYSALSKAGINTFLDDEEIGRGERLAPAFEAVIKSSRASVVVLSNNYASSTWCLDELVLILEQHRNSNQFVIPIFYHVDPTHVRKQQSIFGEALAKHTHRLLESETDADKKDQWAQKIQLWKMALTQIADLKGVDAQGRKETELIEEVVIHIHRRLGVPLSSTLPLLIGMDYYTDLLTSWLIDGSSHAASILTIAGMSGIGKTSLAKHVYQLHSTQFDKSSFIEGINAQCNQSSDGLLRLQKQLHAYISKTNPLQVNDGSVYTSKIENALARKRVLIVLDDIASPYQLDVLLGNKGLHPGSRVIVTTMDASLTERCALFKLKVQPQHTQVFLKGLHESGSLELFCFHAFKSNGSVKEGFEDVAKVLVKYCEGHPLALEVLGKSLHKRDVAFWENCIEALKKEPLPTIYQTLKASYDSLPSNNDKDLFKHIACFFVGHDRHLTETVLNACGLDTRSGIQNLIDRCLLSIGWNNKLMMHPLVQEMGRSLVRQESPHKPWKRTRIWSHEESFKVLKQERGNINLLGLALDMKMLEKKKSFELKTEALSQMYNLELLQLNYVRLSGCFVNFPRELRWLCMHGFPLKSIPSDLSLENLVALDMSYSNIESFDVSYGNPQLPGKRQKVTGSCSEDKRLLGSLKILDLSFCKQLRSLGGFFELPALESLIIMNCTSLVEVCESVGQCAELTLIDMSSCYKLKKVPISIGKLENVKTLLVDGCNSLFSQIERWDMNSSDISVNSQASSVQSDLKSLTFFIPSSLKVLSLANNNLSNESFPMDISSLSMLKELSLDYNPIVSMPNCLRTLPSLEGLSMGYCENLISIEHPPRTLRLLSISSYKPSLRKIKFDPEMSPLKLRGWELSSDPSTEIDGMVKIQAMSSVEDAVYHRLGWTNLEFIRDSRLKMKTPPLYGEGSTENSEAQMYYEFGVFSTFYEGKEMPDWIRYRTEGPCISFTIPSSSKKLRGFNCCCVETYAHNSYKIPTIKISNITKNHTWVYCHYIDELWVGEEGYLSMLTHWMFGENEMKGGDHITIDVAHHDDYRYGGKVTKECGISLVYDEDGKTVEEEDVLDYYKSWNHIIGGDLSAFQLKTGEYILNIREFLRHSSIPYGHYFPFIDHEASFKENGVAFKAFSKKKSGRSSHSFTKEVE